MLLRRYKKTEYIDQIEVVERDQTGVVLPFENKQQSK